MRNKNIFSLSLFFLLILSGCTKTTNVLSTVSSATQSWQTTINATLSCEIVLHIHFGDGIDDFAPYQDSAQIIPHFITLDQDGNLYLDDQVNSRILKYTDLNQPPSIIDIPRYRVEDGLPYYPIYWLGMVVSNDHIYILHNPVAIADEHLLVSVHEMDGTETALIDINNLTQLSESARSTIGQNWAVYSIHSDENGGVFLFFPNYGYIHIDSDLDVDIVDPVEMGFQRGSNLISGWNGILYSSDANGIVMANYRTEQSIVWNEFRDGLQTYGLVSNNIIGVDSNGNALFTSGSGVGIFDPETEMILFVQNEYPEYSDMSLYYADYLLTMAPDGAIYRFDSTNWPESRKLLRCEFVPLP